MLYQCFPIIGGSSRAINAIHTSSSKGFMTMRRFFTLAFKETRTFLIGV
ncbi:hypothetical protein [Lysinibacillus parviboronicapiens]|nr:hypothetical protein [Lysinibacillus parviboronicapiens]